MRNLTTRLYSGFPLALACAIALAARTALAQPTFDHAHVDTEKNTDAWIWVEDYLANSPDGLNFESLEPLSAPQHGNVSYNPSWGVLVYSPDEDYEGFDGFTYTIEDELGQRSEPVFVFIYVEPEGSATNLAPVIVGFGVERLPGEYRGFNGYVLDDQNPYGRVVEFGGMLEGQTTTVGYNGRFSLLGTIPEGTGGYVTVKYLDPFNVYSEELGGWAHNYY